MPNITPSLQRVDQAIQQAQAKGQLDAAGLAALHAEQVPIAALIAKHLGITPDKVRKQVAAGAVTYGVLQRALSTAGVAGWPHERQVCWAWVPGGFVDGKK